LYASLPFTGFSTIIYAVVGLSTIGIGGLARWLARRR